MMQKGQILIWIIVGVLVIAVAGGAYYLGRSTTPKPSATPNVISQTPQPTPTSSPVDETANWKTYTNDRFGYSIKYPNIWKVYPEHFTDGISIFGLQDPKYPGGQNILIEVDGNTSISPKEYIVMNVAPISNPQKVSSQDINGLKGEKWSFNSGRTIDDNYAIFLTSKNKRYILIKELSNKDTFSGYSSVIDQVISTFKLL